MVYKIFVLCLFALCSCGEDGWRDVFDLPEGSSCAWNGLEGKCININNCQSAKDAIERKGHHPICSFHGMTPIVCCTICKPNIIITDPFKKFEVDSRFNKTSKARDNCLKYLKTLNYPCILARSYEERSISDQNCIDTVTPSPLETARYRRSLGDVTSTLEPPSENQTFTPPYPPADAPAISAGQAAYRRQYPHMALLGYGDDIQTAQWLCGGSVISEKYILTAAHCISSPAVGPVKFIALGILKRSDPPDLWQTHNVKRIIAHPEYQPPSKYNDIALLETEDMIAFNTDILPACLPLVPETDETAEATGWGALGHRQGLADVLQTICSFEGVKPIICCADCEAESIVDLDPDVNLAYYKTGEKSRDKCLEHFQKLPYPCQGPSLTRVAKYKNNEKNCYDIDVTLSIILGGRNADRDQFPHMALLGYGNDMKTAEWLCGGSVISEKFILTAGHCISSPSVGSVKYVALGILKRTDPPELWQTHNVKRIIAHPEYKPPSKYHDIALLETEDTISFNVHVLPACLHLNEESDLAADATGWGALGHRKELADILQTVTLHRFENEECQRAYPKHRLLRHGYNHTTQMCYGHRQDPKDTCQGDSGGPLQSTAHLSDCLFTILGVTSYGRACGFAGGAGIYTRVYHYVPWIESIVWP